MPESNAQPGAAATKYNSTIWDMHQ